MSKAQKKPVAPTATDAAPHLDEKITTATDHVARAVKRYRVPVLVGVVAIIALLGLSAIVQWNRERQIVRWNNEIHEAFRIPEVGAIQTIPVEQQRERDLENARAVRERCETLRPKLAGKVVEPYFVTRYASWLWESRADEAAVPANRRQALEILQGALGRHPDHELLKERVDQFAKALELDADFQVPAPPAAPVLTPIPGPDGNLVPPVGAAPEATPPEAAAPGEKADGDTAPGEANPGEGDRGAADQDPGASPEGPDSNENSDSDADAGDAPSPETTPAPGE